MQSSEPSAWQYHGRKHLTILKIIIEAISDFRALATKQTWIYIQAPLVSCVALGRLTSLNLYALICKTGAIV